MNILGSIGRYARAAAPGALAARVGYLHGEDEREQREIAQAHAARAEKRQSILDQIKAKGDLAAIAKTEKETGEIGKEHPKLLNQEDLGDPVLYNDDGSTTPLLDRLGQPVHRTKPATPKRGTPEYNEMLAREAAARRRGAPPRTVADPADKDLNDQIRNVNSQIGATDRASTANANDFDASEATVRARADSLRTRRDSLTHVGDSLNAVQRSRAAAKSGGTVPKLTPAPTTTKKSITQDQYDYLRTSRENGGAGLTDAEIRSKYNVGTP